MTCGSRSRFLLAGVGCAALLAYTLACKTSFSPDDTQVLYPAFDPASGASAVAVYDRATGRSDTLFAALPAGRQEASGDAVLMRAQWLCDGKHVLIAHAGPKGEDGKLCLQVLPRGVRDPIRDLGSIEVEKAPEVLMYPLCVVASNLYLSDPTKISRIDLTTGRTASVDNTNRLVLMSGGDDATIVGFAGTDDHEGNAGARLTIGVLDPQTLLFRPVITMTNAVAEGVFPAFDPRTRQLIFVTGTKSNLELRVVKDGREIFRRSLARGESEQHLGPWLDVGPRNDRVVTAYVTQLNGADVAQHGVVEIPLSDDPPRWTPLFTGSRGRDGDDALIFAQGGLSHDGQVWAVATTLLPEETIKTADRALYLVDLAKTKPEITKVPIAPPPDRDGTGDKPR